MKTPEIMFSDHKATIIPMVQPVKSRPSIVSPLTDRQLEKILDGCRLNQRTLQKQLYYHYYGYAISITSAYNRHREKAVEIANEGFLRIYTELKRPVPRYKNTVALFTAWFKTIMVDTCNYYAGKL